MNLYLKFKLKTMIGLLISCGTILSANASVLFRPETIDELKSLNELQTMDTYYVKESQVAWANYPLLRKDFPHLSLHTEQEIDYWIVKNFSYLSVEQIEQKPPLSSPIPVDLARHRLSYRQPAQGRGDIAIAFDQDGKEIGLVDLKGTGFTRKRRIVSERLWKLYQRHGLSREKLEKRGSINGLVALSDAILETAIAQSLNSIFENQNHELPVSMIEHYFIIRLPFNILRGQSKPAPAAIIGRQAHVGRIWLGINPFYNLSNIKQTDFFGSYTDTGTTRIRLPELPEYLNGRRMHSLSVQREAVEQVIDRFLSGETNLIQTFIDEIVQNIRKRFTAPLNLDKRKSLTLLESIELIAKWIIEDPLLYSRYSEALLQFQRMGRSDLLSSPEVQNAILKLLSVDWSTNEDSRIIGNDMKIERSPRRFGIALIPSLKKTSRTLAIQKATSNEKDLKELSRVLMFLPWDEYSLLFERIKNNSVFRNIYAHELRKLALKNKNFLPYWEHLLESFPESQLYKNDSKQIGYSCRNIFKK